MCVHILCLLCLCSSCSSYCLLIIIFCLLSTSKFWMDKFLTHHTKISSSLLFCSLRHAIVMKTVLYISTLIAALVNKPYKLWFIVNNELLSSVSTHFPLWQFTVRETPILFQRVLNKLPKAEHYKPTLFQALGLLSKQARLLPNGQTW